MPFLGRFALLSLSDGAGASHALTEDCTFLDFASPGSTVLGQMFPAIQFKSKTLQGRFQVVLVALFGTALGPFTFLQLTKENLLWQSCAGHSGHMASPSQLCLCNQGGYAWHNCLADDFTVSVLTSSTYCLFQTVVVCDSLRVQMIVLTVVYKTRGLFAFSRLLPFL